jgi:hypothetical protein
MYATAYFFNVKQPRNGKTKEVDMVFFTLTAFGGYGSRIHDV